MNRYDPFIKEFLLEYKNLSLERIGTLSLTDAVTSMEYAFQMGLLQFEYNKKTVMLAPATGFYGTPGLGKQEVRLAYVLNLDAINIAMDCLEKALQVYPGRV